MKILVIGATGVIGKAVVEELKDRHEIIMAAHKNGDVHVDITDINSIKKMYQQLPVLDGVIVTTGNVHFAPFKAMTDAHYRIGIESKLLGQVNIVLEGVAYLNQGGSFTLTSGSANRDPYKQGSGPALVNGALDGFVKSVALELPNALRINVVSPSILSESIKKYANFFRGFKSVDAKDVALAYSKSVEGGQTGQIYKVGNLFD